MVGDVSKTSCENQNKSTEAASINAKKYASSELKGVGSDDLTSVMNQEYNDSDNRRQIKSYLPSNA